MSISFQRRLLQTKFENWLKDSVYSGAGIQTDVRQYLLYEFTLDLIEFLRKFGYSITEHERDVAKNLAAFIFKAQNFPRSKIQIANRKDERRDDYDMYLHRVNSDAWDRFFYKYSFCEDFDISDSTGRFITYSIPCFAWNYVNVDSSPATRIVDEYLESSDSEGDDMRRPRNRIVDPYLTDQQNNISKYNRWD